MTTVIPIVYGNSAQALKANSKANTHTWTLYIRSPMKKAFESVVKSVTIKLHHSFESPVRLLEKPPYEITEFGWGEFEVGLRLDFINPSLKPLFLKHPLRLFGTDTTVQISKRHIVSETFDQLVIPISLPALDTSMESPFGARNYLEEEGKALESIDQAKKKINMSMQNITSQLEQTMKHIENVEKDIALLEKGHIPSQVQTSA